MGAAGRGVGLRRATLKDVGVEPFLVEDPPDRARPAELVLHRKLVARRLLPSAASSVTKVSNPPQAAGTPRAPKIAILIVWPYQPPRQPRKSGRTSRIGLPVMKDPGMFAVNEEQ
jgi:hypothetical protein